MLRGAGAAVVLEHWPSHGGAWRAAWQAAAGIDPARQRALVDPDAATAAAGWLSDLALRRWRPAAAPAATVTLILEGTA
jgi:hypothetical protein